MRASVTFRDVGDIRADAHLSFLEFNVFDKAGAYQGMTAFDVGSEGLALRLAGAFNAIKQEDVSPIYPTDVRRRLQNVTDFNNAVAAKAGAETEAA